MKSKLAIVFTSVLIILYSFWFFYEKSYPDWWNNVHDGDQLSMYRADMENDYKTFGYIWDGKRRTLGGIYYTRSTWIRTEYVASMIISDRNFNESSKIEKWEIKKLQYGPFHIFQLGWLGFGKLAFQIRKAIFGY